MTLEAGKFYIQDNITYICTIGTGIAVYDRLEYLVAFVAPYEYATGTAEDPIKWFGGGLAIEEGKYYTQNGIIYVGIASSEIPVYGDLSSLATYVKVYVPEPVIPVGETPDHPIEYIGGIMSEKIKVLGVLIDSLTAKAAMQEAIRYMETEPINTIEVLAGQAVIELVETGDLREKLEKI